jgi:hypothetical protein
VFSIEHEDRISLAKKVWIRLVAILKQVVIFSDCYSPKAFHIDKRFAYTITKKEIYHEIWTLYAYWTTTGMENISLCKKGKEAD